MQAHSINRLTIDWSAFRTKVFARATGAQSIADTYGAIQVALDALGDGHSVYYAANGTVLGAAGTPCGRSVGDTPAPPDKVGYVKVPSFSGSAAQATAILGSLISISTFRPGASRPRCMVDYAAPRAHGDPSPFCAAGYLYWPDLARRHR